MFSPSSAMQCFFFSYERICVTEEVLTRLTITAYYSKHEICINRRVLEGYTPPSYYSYLGREDS